MLRAARIKFSRSAVRRGLTLIELVVVIAILAILAALLIPRLGNLDRNAKITASAANLGEATKFMDTFKAVSKNKIPDGYDSLLSTGGTAIYPGNGNPMQNSGVNTNWLTATTLTTAELSSLRRVSSNIVAPGGPTNALITVYDHDVAATNANLSTDAATARTLDTTTNVAIVNAASTQGAAIYKNFNLSPTDTNFRLIALGIGHRCTLIGRNSFGVAIGEPTTADDVTPNSEFSYTRPIALFRVSTDTNYFAEFVGTVTSYGKPAAQLRTFVQ